MKKLTHNQIVKRQKELGVVKRYPLCVVLNNIRSLYNVGSIFRTADGSGVDKIWICGITGYPPNNQISKTALGAEDSVAWEYCQDIEMLLKDLKNQDWQIVLLEQMDGSIVYDQFKPKGKICLVLGNEIEGISEDIVALCDQAIEIEMDGLKNSLNVSVAFGIIAYHMRRFMRR